MEHTNLEAAAWRQLYGIELPGRQRLRAREVQDLAKVGLHVPERHKPHLPLLHLPDLLLPKMVLLLRLLEGRERGQLLRGQGGGRVGHLKVRWDLLADVCGESALYGAVQLQSGRIQSCVVKNRFSGYRSRQAASRQGAESGRGTCLNEVRVIVLGPLLLPMSLLRRIVCPSTEGLGLISTERFKEWGARPGEAWCREMKKAPWMKERSHGENSMQCMGAYGLAGGPRLPRANWLHSTHLFDVQLLPGGSNVDVPVRSIAFSINIAIESV